MKLISYVRNGEALIGVTDGKRVARLNGRLDAAVTDMLSLMTVWDTVGEAVRAVRAYDYSLDEVRVRPPIARPGKILGIGLNYADHVAEAGMEMPTQQIWFAKMVNTVAGPFDSIHRPTVSVALDYEAELVVVIGKTCRHVSKEDAAKVIFGYCAGNDVSVRDWQMRTTQFLLGKTFDTHAPYGPWIATADELDPSDLFIRSYVNGEKRQDSRTKHLVFNCADQIAYLSQVMTLEPGDLIFTGTPGGVGAAMKPPKWLVPGDKVRVEIEGIGHIENTVVSEQLTSFGQKGIADAGC
jgi:ureidoglycolate lyase